MHHLGIPTTRALSLVSTGDSVMRDMFYDGRAKPEPGAIVCRVAPSFLRFGNFELPASRKDVALLRTLLDYTLRTHFAELGTSGPDAYAAWLAEVARRTATLMAEWMRVGFVHGVMNTDNMSVLGLTLDYGPFGMLDHFDPDFTPNTTDAGQRRYRFAKQPRVARWNLFKLGEALAPLLGSVEPIERALELYTDTFESEQRRVLAAKLGLAPFRAEGPESADDPASDAAFIDALFTLLSAVETDFTLFFRNLANVPLARLPELDSATLLAPLQAAYYDPEAAERVRAATRSWLERYRERATAQGLSDALRKARMDAVNPRYILRNYLAQLAIDATEQGDANAVGELLDVLRRPYDEQPGRERFAEKRPDWARQRAGCSMLSCSS
jgi:uncharacterized protein YdiU (UPF0061 family)